MGTPVILDWKRINPEEDFKYLPASNSNSLQTVSIRVKNPDTGEYVPFIHQSPVLSLPFGISCKNAEQTRYSCDMTFGPSVSKPDGADEYEGDDEMIQYMNFLLACDEANKKAAFKNVDNWFNKKDKEGRVVKKIKLTQEMVDMFYYHNIKEAREPAKYGPTILTKLLYDSKNSRMDTTFYNAQKEEISVDDVKPGMKIIAIVQTSGLWFADKSFGMSLKVKQLLAFGRPRFEGCAIKFDVGIGEEETPEAVAPGFVLSSS